MKKMYDIAKDLFKEQFIQENEDDSEESLIQNIIQLIWSGVHSNINLALEIAESQIAAHKIDRNRFYKALNDNFGWFRKGGGLSWSSNSNLEYQLTYLTNDGEVKLYRPSIPKTISNAKNIYALEIIGLDDDESLKNIFSLSNLRSLKISDSSIRTIPNGFSSLNKLNVVGFYKCSIAKLPDDFGYIPHLEELSLQYTDLRRLPNSIIENTTLNYLRIDETPLSKSDDVKSIIGQIKNNNPKIKIYY